MHSNRSAPTLMNIEQMYSVVRGETGSWGIEGYEVAKKYCDPLKQAKDREYLKQVKGKKSDKYLTRRGHFLDDQAKQWRGYKVPVQYDIAYKWVTDKKDKPKSVPTKKMTFIDEIFLQNTKKDFPKPGAGQYPENRTIETNGKKWAEYGKKKINFGPRKDFLQDYEHLGATLAGPGQYNPHPILPKLKINNSKPAELIKKHQEFDKFKLERLKVYPNPDVGTYKPIPVDYDTFGKSLQFTYDKKKPEESKIKHWGNPPKQEKQLTKSKSTTNVQQYNMIAYWPGKQDGGGKEKGEKKYNWMNKITKGVQKSIYY